ncbi:uncharacterized protein LOC144341797 [Saccoglossus kowalevskii]
MKLSLLLVVYTCVIACANARGLRQVEIISATAELRCSDGSLVNCLVDPCDVTSCELPYAGCEADYCGGCNAIYYDADGNVLDCSDFPIRLLFEDLWLDMLLQHWNTEMFQQTYLCLLV